MIELVRPIAEMGAAVMEVLGVLTISVFAFYTLIFGLAGLIQKKAPETVFREVRQSIGRGILLGLECLVAADIIHTVAVELTFETVGILAVVVLIRTFLSFTLDVELTGRWPWQKQE